MYRIEDDAANGAVEATLGGLMSVLEVAAYIGELRSTLAALPARQPAGPLYRILAKSDSLLSGACRLHAFRRVKRRIGAALTIIQCAEHICANLEYGGLDRSPESLSLTFEHASLGRPEAARKGASA
jgi:hypothetical protein